MSHMLGRIKSVRLHMQFKEVIGADNAWFCSQCYNKPVDDIELLWRYFVEQGGALDFARRWNEAMSDVNRYYAAKFYGKEITDEQVLWEYYVAHNTNNMLTAQRHQRHDNWQ